jgi:superfamily II DNA or RNA helicase
LRALELLISKLNVGGIEKRVLAHLYTNPTTVFTSVELAKLFSDEESVKVADKVRTLFFRLQARFNEISPFFKDNTSTNAALHWFDPEGINSLLEWASSFDTKDSSDNDVKKAPVKEFSISNDGVLNLDGQSIIMTPAETNMLRIINTLGPTFILGDMVLLLEEDTANSLNSFKVWGQLDKLLDKLEKFGISYRDKYVNTTGDTFDREVTLLGMSTADDIEKQPQELVTLEYEVTLETSKILRPRQLEVVEKLNTYISSKASNEIRGYVVAPTGTGKTVMMTRLLEDIRTSNPDANALIVVPTKQLVDQTIDALREHGYGGFIGKVGVGSSHKQTHGASVMTASSFARRVNGSSPHTISPEDFDMVVIDEAHHLQGQATFTALRSKFRHALQIGFTATPDYDDKRQLKHILKDEIDNIGLTEAIDDKLIAPYSVIHLETNTDFREVKIKGKDYDPEDLERVVNTDSRNIAIARYAATKLQGIPTLYNTGRITHAEELASALRLHGLKVMAVHGKIPKAEQQAILAAFNRGELDGMVQVSMLGEGFNEPRIEAVVNVIPTLSTVKAMQRAGRGQRTNESVPEKVTIVIECEDVNYTKSPVFYNEAAAGSSWSYFPNSTEGSAEQREKLQNLASHNDNGVVARNQHDYSGSNTIETNNELTFTAVEKPVLHVPKTVAKGPPKASKAKVEAARNSLREKRREKTEEELTDEQLEYLAMQTAAQDYMDTLAQTSERYISGLHDDNAKSVALYLFGENINGDDTEAALSIAMKLTKTASIILSDVVSTDELAVFVDKPRIKKLQAAIARIKRAEIPTRNLSQSITYNNFVSELRPEWTYDAACHHTNILKRVKKRKDIEPGFFPKRGQSTKPVKNLCATCPVAVKCLDFSIETGIKHGVWGGQSERERRALRKGIKALADGDKITLERQYKGKLQRNEIALHYLRRIVGVEFNEDGIVTPVEVQGMTATVS